MGYEIKIHSRKTFVPQGKAFELYLANPKNKIHLTEFLSREFLKLASIQVQQDKALYISCGIDGQRTVFVTKNGDSTVVPSLQSPLNEADGCLMLHAAHAAYSVNQARIIIWSPDTDVAVLAIHFSQEINADIWFKTGVKKNTRFLHISDIAHTLGQDLRNSILAFHCLTGCDCTSSFAGKGKGEAWKLFVAHVHDYRMLKHIGDSIEFSEEVEKDAAKFICSFYDKYGLVEDGNMNELCYKLFTMPGKEKLLPPTDDSFHQHMEWVNYTGYLWKHALDVEFNVPSPVGYGWELEDGMLNLIYMTKDSAPNSLVELVKCGCKSACSRTSCSCRKSKVPCTLFCKCSNDQRPCLNPHSIHIDDDNDEISDEE